MPRNGQGVYSLPPVYEAVTGETIEAQQHNVPLEDIASDLNNARPISTGGTGGQSATQARENLDVYSKAESIQAIGDIPAKETPVDADNVVIVDSEDGNKPKKSKVNALVNTMRVGVAMAGANSKETLDDGDFLGGVLADGSTAFKTPWGKIKKVLQAFFDGRYLKLVGGTIQGILTVSGEGSQRGVFRNTGDGDSWINFYTRDQNWYSEFGQRANGAAYVWANGQEFRFQTDGSFLVPGNIFAGGGSSRLEANGNIVGGIWNNFGASDAYTAINIRIETRAAAFADDRANQVRNEVSWQLNQKAGVYRGDWVNETNFPIGHTIMCWNDKVARNEARTPRVDPRSADAYNYNTSGPALSGIWRARGSWGDGGASGSILERTE
ncbi:Hypothetical protein BROD_2239 [Brucella sp. NF 2653]|uniref:hypothetical protein n=1 Tax=unclassified Brucella TaxID=2632610 RepID=UPI0001B48CB3|nr:MULTISPECIES: hypothetical protein [unclassified Brucella]EEZ33923.1 predicted protein [Brucella sp. 83/13]EFM61771.1 Hypothetical protein BROD_2239 [Brucella sp. NF 2653]